MRIYISHFGTAWSAIKEYDAAHFRILLDRTAVDLKDKARNMKAMFLHAGLPLPPNLHLATNTVEIRALLAGLDH